MRKTIASRPYCRQGSRPGRILLLALGLLTVRASGMIIDHTCTNLAAIPLPYIEAAKSNARFFYGTASHGTQLVEGLFLIEESDVRYAFACDWSLPAEKNAVCVLYQNQSPDLFFSSVQGYLNANPTINLAMFSWCGEAYWYDPEIYISQMLALEQANPRVRFVYMTGHAQEDGCSGCRRHLFNERVRAHCRDNDKILFDFADLDAWYDGAQNTFRLDGDCGCSGMAVPLQHPHYYGEEAYHTTKESCINKGKAVWWMLARLAGWGSTTPVELRGFAAWAAGQKVIVQWQTLSESSNLGFGLERSEDNRTFQQIAFIPGHGSVQTPQFYRYEDSPTGLNRRYYYRLRQMDRDGQATLSAVIEILLGTPDHFELNQNYPNPFYETTEVSFSLPKAVYSQVRVCDLLGREVRLLHRGPTAAGPTVLPWDGRDNTGKQVAEGVFFLVYSDEQRTAIRRLVRLK